MAKNLKTIDQSGLLRLLSRARYVHRLLASHQLHPSDEDEVQEQLEVVNRDLELIITRLSLKKDPSDLWTYNIPQLRNLARHYAIQSYSRMDKETLIMEILSVDPNAK